MAKLGSLKALTQLAKAASDNESMVLTVDVNDVVSEEQVRKRFRNLDELGDSIEREGQQSPIIVSPKNKEGKYVIQKGERRWRSIKLKGLKTIRVLVNGKEQDPIDALAGQLIENIQRDDLTAIEISAALGVMSDQGVSGAEIAKRIGKSPKFVSVHLALRQLSTPVQKLVDEELIGDVDLLYTLEQIAKIDMSRAEALCNQARNTGVTRKQAVEVHQSLKAKKSEENIVKGSKAGTLESATGTEATVVKEDPKEVVTHNVAQSHENKAKESPFISDGASPVSNLIESEMGVSVMVSSLSLGVSGRLLLDREPTAETKAWVQTQDGHDVEVEVSALTITSVRINA